MNLVCDIVKDMMPIYLDGTASKASKKLIKKHVKRCTRCEDYLKMCKHSEEVIDKRASKNKGKNDDLIFLPDDGYEVIADRVNKSVMLERIVTVSAAVAAVVTTLIIFMFKKDKRR